MAMLLPLEATDRWAVAASRVIEVEEKKGKTVFFETEKQFIGKGIGSQLLTRDVSDSYFALLHLLVEVCGHPSSNEREKFVEIWFNTAGTPLLEASSPVVNDSLAELLQRSQWHSMKLIWVNGVLLSRFDAKVSAFICGFFLFILSLTHLFLFCV
jgi:hypothetical protein